MESAIFGLIGVALGAILAVAREWWFQNRKSKKEAEYLVILVSCELERYASRCAEVVGDDGLCEGQPDEEGYSSIQVPSPKFDPHEFSVEWKSLPGNLMYAVLNFPNKAGFAEKTVSEAFEHAATPPDYWEGFEERQLQYAQLGLAALELADQLRNYVGLASLNSNSEWNPAKYMERHRADIDLIRKKRAIHYKVTDV